MTVKPLIGFPLLPVPDGNGELNYPTLDESVRQSIRVILTVRPGELLLRPFFGAGLPNFLQEPNSIATRRKIEEAVTEALKEHERRILLDRVEVTEVPDEPTHIRIEFAYRLRRTGAARQLALTLLLEA